MTDFDRFHFLFGKIDFRSNRFRSKICRIFSLRKIDLRRSIVSFISQVPQFLNFARAPPAEFEDNFL